MKYLYIYNYFAPYEEDLCHAEFRRVFHTPFSSRYFFTDQDYDYTRSVFIKERLTILHTASSVEEIIQALERDHLYYEDFKVIYYKNEITHQDYRESLAYARALSDPIAGTTDMEHPKVVFALTKFHDAYYFGLLERNMDWHKHEVKPHSYSHSLPLRVARTALNIGLGDRQGLSVIDPCCGVGTVVLEGLSMGLDIIGSDINRYVSYQGRLNLEYFGYDPLRITRKDMHEITQHYDLAIMDVPYGVYSNFSLEEQIDLVKAASSFCEELVVITHEKIDEGIRASGFTIMDQCVYKKSNFYRYLTYAKKVNQ